MDSTKSFMFDIYIYIYIDERERERGSHVCVCVSLQPMQCNKFAIEYCQENFKDNLYI